MTKSTPDTNDVQDPDRRDFIVVATYAMGAIGAPAVVWPLIDQLTPSADTLALANTDVDLAKLAVVQSITSK